MIKFVYFDVGGVVIRDFSGTNKWIEMKRDMGIKPDRDQEFDEWFEKYEAESCVGRDIQTLVPMMKQKFGLSFADNYSFLNDFVDRFEKNESIWPVIKKAKEKYRVGLLTNMYTNMLDLIYKNELMPDVEWDVVVDSSVEGVLKPQRQIFELAQIKTGVDASEILFVENSKKHVDAAKKMGWQTFWYDSKNSEGSDNEMVKWLSEKLEY